MTSPEFQLSNTTVVFGPSYDVDHRLNADRAQVDLYSTALRPYEDDDFLNHRLNSQSRIVRQNPEIVPFIEEAIGADDDDTIKTVADLLTESFDTKRFDSQPAISTLLSYITITDTVSLLKNRMFGDEAPADRCNAISQLLARKLALRVPDERVVEFMISGQYLIHRMKHLESRAPQSFIDYNFLQVKVMRLVDDLKFRAFAMAYVNAVPEYDNTSPSKEQMDRDSALVTEVFNEMRNNQQYGIKLGYKPHRWGGSLIFSRPPMSEESGYTHPNLHPLSYRTPAVAEIVHSNLRSFKQLKPKAIEVTENAMGYSYEGTGLVAQYFVGPNGELFADRHCDTSLLAMFVKQGKYGAYRQLQAEVLAGYFDMTRPAELVDKITHVLPGPKAHDVQTSNSPMDTFSRLVIPRVRPMGAAVTEHMDTEEQGSRSIKYHGVVWHRRRLPEGWSASPQAREMAESIGLVLKENETFVREHHRGTKKLGEIVGHQLVERS